MRRQLKALLRGDEDEMMILLSEQGTRWAVFCSLVILLGTGIYGSTIGLWRAPLQSLYTAIKFPLLIFLTCAATRCSTGCWRSFTVRGSPFAKPRSPS